MLAKIHGLVAPIALFANQEKRRLYKNLASSGKGCGGGGTWPHHRVLPPS